MGGSVFLSHASEDQALARVLKSWIEESFLGQVGVFVSTNSKDLRSGDEWFQVIKQAMEEASILIVLCSSQSVNRSWINFEAGAGWAKGIPIISVCHSGMSKGLLPTPLSFFQGIDIVEPQFGETLFVALASHLGYTKTPKIGFSEFKRECLEAIDATSLLPSAIDDYDEWGIVDHQVVIEEDMVTLRSIIESIGAETEEIGRVTKHIGSQINSAKTNQSQGTSRHIQRLSKKLSKHYDSYSTQLDNLNREYASVASRVFDSLDFAVKYDYTNSDEEVNEVLTTIYKHIKTLMGAIISAKKNFTNLGQTMQDVPKLQRHLNKSLIQAHSQVDAFVQNMGKTLERTSIVALSIEERVSG